jgi:hypothetical protein
MTIHKLSRKGVSLDTADKKNSPLTPDKYIVLILNALNEGRPIKMKKGVGKIKRLKSIAKKLDVQETNMSLRNALNKCTKKQYVLEFKKKKDLAKIFYPNAEEYDLYATPCYMLTQKGIEMLNGIGYLIPSTMNELIQSHITSIDGLSEDKVMEYLEIFKDVPNPFNILLELETLSLE